MMARPTRALQQAHAKIRELEEQLAGTGQELVQAGERAALMEKSYQSAAAERDRMRFERDEARKERDAVKADNDNLRDQCHFLEIGNARLEGQLQRVEKFDPVTERMEYQDGITAMQRRGWGADAAVNLSPSKGARHWYRRAG